MQKISLPTDKNVVLALSGGPDSVFLGEHLIACHPANNIIVAHFNHRLRRDADDDEAFCKAWAEEKGCAFEKEVWKTPVPSEEKARNARYAFLERVRKKYDAYVVLVGTHADDNSETILFQFLRGSGAKGLSGINKRDEQRKIFRPLLSLSKGDILTYLEKNCIPYRTDSTNAENVFSRNFLRNSIIPLLNERFPFWKKNILRQAEVFSEIDDYMQKKAADFLEEEKNAFCKKHCSSEERQYSRTRFSSLHLAVKNYVLRHLFSPHTLDFEQIKNIREFLQTGKSGKKMQLKGKEILLSHEYFFITSS